MIGWLALLVHLALVLSMAPVLAGLLARRAHPRQAWRDLRKLYRKPVLRPERSLVFDVAPALSLSASLVAALLVPSFGLGMVTAPLADLVLLAGLFALSRAALLLAALECGDGLAGLAGQRLAVLRLVADPALLVLILVVAAATGSSNLDTAATALRDNGLHAPLLVAAFAGVIVLLAGAEREPLMLGFAGRDLAILQFAAQLRLVTVLSLLATLVLPFGLAPAGAWIDAWVAGAALWAVKLAVLGAASVALGTLRARLVPEQARELAALGLVLALLAAVLLFAGQRAA